jgi:ABC-type Fe3+ transport system substrate-binding protein
MGARKLIRHAALGAVALIVATGMAAQAQDILTYKGADRTEKLIEGAKKEGQVNFYSAMIANQALRPIVEAFNKKYPFVKATYWRADSEDIFQKVSAETRANNVVGDVVEGTGVGEYAVEGGLTVPYYTPLAKEYPEQYRDPRGQWTVTRLSYFSIAYNTRLVAADKVPKSYEDLLDPQWQGKMAWRIGSASGTALFLSNLRLAWGEEKARAYFLKLKEQKIINFGSGSARTLVDRVIAGEYPIALNIFAHHPLISKAKGAPVNSQLMAPVATTAATMVIPKGVRRPHAALLLIDFVLSKEGQEILLKAEYFPAHPGVPPSDLLAPVVPAKAGIAENFVGPPVLNKYAESSEKIFDELFR